MICRDADWLRAIVTHPKVWPWVSEDGYEPSKYEPQFSTSVYLKTSEAGFLSFKPVTRCCCEVHICMLPKVRDALEQARRALAWMAERGIKRFMAKIPSVNKHAIRLARQCGFIECGRLHSVCARGGKMVDLIVMEASHA